MEIEVFEQAEGLRGGREIWVRVLSNSVVDWPQVKSNLDAEQAELMSKASVLAPSGYFPHHPSLEERADHGYRFEDWWTFAPLHRDAS